MFPQDFKHQHITSQCHIKTVPAISMQSINVEYGDDLGGDDLGHGDYGPFNPFMALGESHISH